MQVDPWLDLSREFGEPEPPLALRERVLEREQALSPRSRWRVPAAVGWAGAAVGVVAVAGLLALAAHSRREAQSGSALSVSQAKLAVLRKSEAPHQFYRRYASVAAAQAAVGFRLIRPDARLASDANLDSVWASRTYEAVLIWKSGIVEDIQPWDCHCDPSALRSQPHGFRYMTLNGWPASTAASEPGKRVMIGPESEAQSKYGVPAVVEVVDNGLDIRLFQYGQNVQPGLLAVAGTLPPRPATSLTITYRHTAIQHRKEVLLSDRPLFLSCDPASGTLPDPARACHLIQTRPRYVAQVTGVSCIGGALRWDVQIAGRILGKPVSRDYDMCAYPQARLWTNLGGTHYQGIVPARLLQHG
jgi:hypothetical protein